MLFNARIKRLSKQIAGFDVDSLTELEEEDAEEASRILSSFVKAVLPTCPREVIEELTTLEKLSIAETYTGSVAGKQLLMANSSSAQDDGLPVPIQPVKTQPNPNRRMKRAIAANGR
jgi:hypothetical protein